jgi:hypothetical protein
MVAPARDQSWGLPFAFGKMGRDTFAQLTNEEARLSDIWLHAK